MTGRSSSPLASLYLPAQRERLRAHQHKSDGSTCLSPSHLAAQARHQLHQSEPRLWELESRAAMRMTTRDKFLQIFV